MAAYQLLKPVPALLLQGQPSPTLHTSRPAEKPYDMFVGVVGFTNPQPRRPSLIHDPTFWFVLLLKVDRARKGHELPDVRLTN